jgi:heat shock protein HslJ
MMHVKVSAVLWMASAFVLGSCSTTPPVRDQTWHWLGSLGSQSSMAAPRPENYTLQFVDGRAAVRADCNRGTGSVTLKGDSVSFGPMATTLMACVPPSRGGEFLRQLGAAERLSVQDGALRIALKGGAGEMFFSRDAKARLAHYRCRGGAVLSAMFTAGQAQVWFAGEYYKLAQERTASGARYADGKTAFDSKGVLGTLRKGDTVVVQDCQVPSQGAGPS